MTSKEIKVYDDWSGGHWGSTGPFKAPDSQYRSVNLQRYTNGTLGPRPGWKPLATTGTAPAPAAGSGSPMYGMMWVPAQSGGGHLIFVSKSDATATLRLNMETLVWSSLSGVGSPVNDMQLGVGSGGNMHAHVYDNVVVGGTNWCNVNTNVGGTISYPDSFSPRASVVHKSRMYSWGDLTYPGRVYYSNVNAYDSWTSAQYFDVGLYRTVMGIWSINDNLLILTLTGAINGRQTEAEWWSLQGTNPITGSLRRLQSGEWPYVPAFAVPYRNTLLWLDVLYDHGLAFHNGSELDTSSLSRLVGRFGSDSQGGSTALVDAAYTYGAPSIIIPYRIGEWRDRTATVIGDYYDNGLQAWEMVGGTWTKASYWNGATEQVVDNNVSLLWSVTGWGGDKLIACTNTSLDGSGAYKFYTRDITHNRPSTNSDTYSSPSETHTDVASSGAGLDCRLWLTPVQAEEGHSVRITRVVVDFDYWKSAYFPAGPLISAQIENYRSTQGWQESSAVQTADLSAFEESERRLPNKGRVVFSFETSGWFSASQVVFPALRNVAIDRVSVHYDRNPQDPR